MTIYKKLVARLFAVAILFMVLAAMAKPPQAQAFCSCTALANNCHTICTTEGFSSQDCQDCLTALDGCNCACFGSC